MGEVDTMENYSDAVKEEPADVKVELEDGGKGDRDDDRKKRKRSKSRYNYHLKIILTFKEISCPLN